MDCCAVSPKIYGHGMKGTVMDKNIIGHRGVVDRNAIIKNVPLKTAVAALIISTECFGPMEKPEIVELVREVHKNLGGRETPASKVQVAVTAALKKLVEQGKVITPFLGTYVFPREEEEGKDSVYLFYYPAYKELAEKNGEEFWQCKIGMTVDNVEKRVGTQVTGNPEKATIALEFKTDHPRELESALHAILKLRGRHIADGGGVEWFKTNPDEVRRIYYFLTSLQTTSGTE